MSKSKTDKQIEMLLRKSMSKKAFEEYCKMQRSLPNINTGTKTFKSAKDYNRQSFKRWGRDIEKED